MSTPLRFNREQWARLMAGQKFSTIRRGARHQVEPGPQLIQCGANIGLVEVSEVNIIPYKSIGYEHAVLEGYATIFELKSVIEGLYPEIRGEDNVTVIQFGPVIWHD